MQAAEQARSARGSNVVAVSDASESEAREITWSRGRELNPRPTDYEAVLSGFSQSRSVTVCHDSYMVTARRIGATVGRRR